MFQAPIHRRTLLRLALLGAGAATLPGRALAAAGEALRWQNWSGFLQAKPSAIHYPRDEDSLRELLLNSSGTLRCFGGSHSFSPLVPTDDTLISLEAMAGLRSHNSDAHTARFGAGSRLAMASSQAWGIGQSFYNEPDINLQSLAGAIATATHGTGGGLGCLSAYIDSLQMMSVDGELLELNAEDGDLFRAACVSLGAMGIVTEIGFRNLPAYRLEEKISVMSLRETMDLMEKEADNHRHMEFFAFPHGRTAIVQTTDITDNPEDVFPEDDSNSVLEMACEVTMRAGWLNRPLQRMLTLFVDEAIKRGPAHQVYANHRTVQFNEMEYTVPVSKGLECLEEVCETIRRERINAFFPIEYRHTAADNTLLSMFSERPGASISVHQYYRMEHDTLFNTVEPIFLKNQGRPHWGKLHNLGASKLGELYPHFDRFRDIRKQLDPKGRLLNPHLRKILGEA